MVKQPTEMDGNGDFQPTKMDGNGDFQPIWAPPPEEQRVFPEKLPGPNRKGSSSKHHFFRGELLNFLGVNGWKW